MEDSVAHKEESAGDVDSLTALFGGMAVQDDRFQEKLRWALTPYPNGLVAKNVAEADRAAAQQDERKWGNRMIGQSNNKMWSMIIGEELVRDALRMKGENPRRPKTMDGYRPDWETDDHVYEVKTRNWTTTGTAGEKVPGVPYKYADVPELYGKPLRIVLVAYQEWEGTHSKKMVLFGDVGEPNAPSARQRRMLDLYESMGIAFVRFSDMADGLLK